MPALSNGNTCWGNRKAFNMHSEYICDSFALGNVFDSSSSATQSFVSSNSYYGFHRVPNEPVEEAMALDVSEDLQSPICEDNAVASCRKRPNSAEQRVDSSKRIRHQGINDCLVPIYVVLIFLFSV